MRKIILTYCGADKLAAFLLVQIVVNAAVLDPAALESSDVGNPSLTGSLTRRADAVEIVAGGQGIGFRSDQFHFAASPQPSDFEVRIRVAALKNTDIWAKAGLMFRAGRGETARFAAVFATPAGAGCLFQSRDTDGAAAANQGYFPANQPFAWLRLRREGDLLTGYAGYDGKHWVVLGTKTIAFGADALLGLAVTSHSPHRLRPQLSSIHDPSRHDAAIRRLRPIHLETIGLHFGFRRRRDLLGGG